MGDQHHIYRENSFQVWVQLTEDFFLDTIQILVPKGRTPSDDKMINKKYRTIGTVQNQK